MAAVFRPRLKVIHRVWSSSPVKRVIAAVLLAASLATGITAATAVATCGISSFGVGEDWGQTNNAHEDFYACFIVDPINCANGNLTEAQTDLAVQGHGPPLQLVRYYNSQAAVGQSSAGAFGYGWSGSYSAHLTLSYDLKLVTVHHDNASTISFELNGSNYHAPVWTQATLVKSGENYIYTQPDRTRYEFNGSGRLMKITDRHNLSLTLTYNSSGRLETVADQSLAVRKLTFTYNASGQIETVTDPQGRVAKYTYSSGNLASVTLPGMEAASWKFGYNGFHEMTSLTNGRGYTTSTTYDGSHRAISQTDPLGRKYSFSYKVTSGIKETTITRPNGSVTIEKFNAAGSPVSVTHAAGTAKEATIEYAYNSAYLVTEVTDANGHVTSYTYDSRGNKLTEKDPNGNEAKWSYNSANDVTSITDPKGQVTTVSPNAAGDPLLITRSTSGGTQETKFEYNSAGDLIRKVDPAGRERKYLISPFNGFPIVEYVGTYESANILHSWVYNLNGELIEEIDGRGYESGNEKAQFATKITRDAQGRPVVTTDPLGNTTKLSYDANGNIATITDGNENASSYVYDAADQKTEVKFANGAVAKTGYDTMGQLVSRTSATGNTTEYKRDLLGQVTESIDPLGRKTTYEYDDAGQLLKSVDAEGRSITYSYDPGGRQTKLDYSSGTTADVSMKYDKNGNVVEMTDGTGTTKRVYDSIDRLTEVSNGKAETVKYDYNIAGDITKLTYPNSKAITRGFDSLGRLSSVVDWFGKETKFSYYRNSQLKATTFPSETGNVDEYGYNPRGDLTQIGIKKGLEVLASFSYGRDKAGQLEKVVQKGFSGRPEELVYKYDTGDRLIKNNSTLYEYDPANAPTKLGSSLFSYDKAGQIATASSGTFSFNKFGQRTKSSPSSGPATSYSYDQAGNLVSVQRPAEGETTEINNTFKYDGTGLRTTETNGASTYPMFWDTTQELPLLLRKGNDFYIYGPEGLPIAQIISSSTHYLHHDQQGSTRVLTSSAGSVIGLYEYSPHGDLVHFSGSQSTQMGYAGQYRSHTSRLIYLRARTYDPVTAQFLSVDPMVSESGDPYGYAEGNPLNRSDPTGLTVFGACGSMSINLIVAGASGTGCITVDGSGNIGFLGYGEGLKMWGSTQDWLEGLSKYVKGVKDLIDIDSPLGAWKTLGKSFGRFFDYEGGLMWSNADSVDQLNGKFDSVTDSLTIGLWEANSMMFQNDNGIYGYINTAGKNVFPWLQMKRGPCEEINLYGNRTRFDLF